MNEHTPTNGNGDHGSRGGPWVTPMDLPETRGPSLVSTMNTILRHRMLIATVTVVTIAAVTIPALLRARSYTSRSAFMAQSSGRSPQSAIAGLAAQFGVQLNQGDASQPPPFYVDLIQSRSVLTSVAEQQYDATIGGQARHGNLTQVFGDADMEQTLRDLGNAVKASSNPRTGVINLSVTTKSPQLSRAISDQLLAAVARWNLQTRQSQAGSERQFTETRLKTAKEDLARAEEQKQELLQSNRQFNRQSDAALRLEQIQREIDLRQQLYLALAQAYEQARINEVRDTPVISIIDAPPVPQRPDSRGLLRLGLIALFLGLVLGGVAAFAASALSARREDEVDEIEEFLALRRMAFDDLRHPWRPVTRVLAGRRGA